MEISSLTLIEWVGRGIRPSPQRLIANARAVLLRLADVHAGREACTIYTRDMVKLAGSQHLAAARGGNPAACRWHCGL